MQPDNTYRAMMKALSVFFHELSEGPAPNPHISPPAPTSGFDLGTLAQMVRDQFSQTFAQPPAPTGYPFPPTPGAPSDADEQERVLESLGQRPPAAPRGPDAFVDHDAPDEIDFTRKHHQACAWQQRRAQQMIEAYPNCEEAEKHQQEGPSRMEKLLHPLVYMDVLAYYCHKLHADDADIPDIVTSVMALPNIGDLRWQLLAQDADTVKDLAAYHQRWEECFEQIEAAHVGTAIIDVDDYQQLLLALATNVPLEYLPSAYIERLTDSSTNRDEDDEEAA